MDWDEGPQDADAGLYLVWRTAAEILRDATLLRAARDHDGRLVGFQRQPVKDHVSAIAYRLRGPGARLRNPVTVGLADGQAWIVDGQQRLLGCIEAGHDAPIPVVVVRADSIAQLRDEFVTVNDTRRLPRALVAEILCGIGENLPPRLGDGTLALLLVEALNHRPASPLRGLVRRPTNPKGTVSDAALARGLSASLGHGALAREGGQRETVMTRGLATVEGFLQALAGAFHEDWDGMDARTSRLMHGTGIVAALHAMDVIHALVGADHAAAFAGPLALLRPHCHWRSGTWAFADGTRLAWDGLQNVPLHRAMLSGHLEAMLRAAIAPRDAAA